MFAATPEIHGKLHQTNHTCQCTTSSWERTWLHMLVFQKELSKDGSKFGINALCIFKKNNSAHLLMTGFRYRQTRRGIGSPTHSLAYSRFLSLAIEGGHLTAWCSLLSHPLWMTRYTICSASFIIYSTWIMQSSTLASFHFATAFYSVMSTKIDWFNFACAPCHLRKVLFLSFR